MKQSIKNAIEKEISTDEYPAFQPGDQIRVVTREKIAGLERKTSFEGVCISRRGDGPDQTFKVRKNSFGVGVERIFLLHSPIVEKIEIVRKGKVRRAKLNYLAGRSAKKARIKEKRVDLEEVNATGEEEKTGKTTEEEEAAAAASPPVEESEEEIEPEVAGETTEETESETEDAEESNSAAKEKAKSETTEPADEAEEPGAEEEDPGE